MTIIADDLSGATDSAVACAVRGLDTVVALVETSDLGTAEAVAFDADTRRLKGDAAAAETARFIRAHAAACSGLLFKKVDSTMRGNLGPEIAALLDVLRQMPRRLSGRRTIVFLAPAFPALGRTTMHGRQHLDGVPLDDTELWRREPMTGSSSLLDVMRHSGLESKLLPIEIVRAGVHAIRAAVIDVADRIDVVVCDAETDEDLAALAQASVGIRVDPVWAGSAGLIGHLLEAAGASRRKPAVPRFVSRAGPLLFVVGSLSPVSRRQAALLATEDVVAFTIEGATRDNDATCSAGLASRFAAAVGAGEDVLIVSTPEAAPSRVDASAVCTALSDLIAPHAGRIGGLFVTGGETARAVLTGMGVATLRPVTEIEPGIPLSIAGGQHTFPVITKAGAFGNISTMLSCRRALHEWRAAAFAPAPFPGAPK